ncbi:hypothetical protein [Pseudoxanthobacter sp.]|uniref:hypothetical protein n=1 Tax=Pseudoxanthobacter sp. TaxID=1925742 RepID=UPI002FE0854D
MPQFIVLAAIAATVVGWKFVRREMARVDERMAETRRAAEAVKHPQPGVTLVRDPVTGVFRPQA